MASPKSSIDYNDSVDFDQLAIQDAEFAEIYQKNGGHFDFHNPEALRQLTKSLLKRDFGLVVELPNDRLCPPVPVRYHYVRWIESLLDSTSDQVGASSVTSAKGVIGLDIGTGASAIYPLLATSTHPDWTMYCTEVDRKSFDYAQKNISLNKLTTRIHAELSSSATDPLIPCDALPDKVDFTICNPPFYSSAEDLAMSEASKIVGPNAICTGAETEMICPEGDFGFVMRILDESLVLRNKIQWYTSMLGKLSSVYRIVAKLKEASISNWAICSLNKTGRTKRWAVAWSFGDCRPSLDLCYDADVPKTLRPLSNTTIPTVPLDQAEVIKVLNGCFAPLDLNWTWDEKTNMGTGSAKSNVWSRSARRKRKRDQEEGISTTEAASPVPDALVVLGFEITLSDLDGDAVVNVCWVRGSDRVIYESFCGIVIRSIRAAVTQKLQEK